MKLNVENQGKGEREKKRCGNNKTFQRCLYICTGKLLFIAGERVGQWVSVKHPERNRNNMKWVCIDFCPKTICIHRVFHVAVAYMRSYLYRFSQSSTREEVLCNSPISSFPMFTAKLYEMKMPTCNVTAAFVFLPIWALDDVNIFVFINLNFHGWSSSKEKIYFSSTTKKHRGLWT